MPEESAMSVESGLRLRTILDTAPEQLRALNEAESAVRLAPGKWSRKEILGHLIDSATNNHQRFVRALIGTGELVFPRYAQDDWVRVQRYHETPWLELIELWAAYNRLLSRIIESVPASEAENICRIGENKPVTLDFLMEDYVGHLEHHLRQILGEPMPKNA
jgi:hypothetical protein